MLITPEGATVLAITHDRGNRRDVGPAVLSNQVGKGKCIYIGSGLEAVFEESRINPVREYLGSLLLPFLESRRSYQMDYFPGITPHYMSSEKHHVLHLLADIGNEVQHLRSRENLVPVNNIKIRLRATGNVKSVNLLRAGTEAQFQQNGEWITVQVPRVHVYEAVHVELA